MMSLMRKLTLFTLLWLPLAVLGQSFQEGVHYQSLPTPVPTSSDDQIEVVELFWYGCPHCYSLEPTVEKWLEHKSDNVKFVRIPAMLGPRWEIGARAYYVAESLGVLDETHAALFNDIHAKKRSITNKEQLGAFFAEHGVDEAAFEKAYGSFEVETKLRRAQELVRKYRTDGVPTIVVNGKYKTSGTMAGSNENIFKVVDYLVKKEGETS